MLNYLDFDAANSAALGVDNRKMYSSFRNFSFAFESFTPKCSNAVGTQ